MAVFNPNPPEPTPQDMTNRSRGPINRRGAGTLFEGIGQVAGATAQAIDTHLIEQIRDDAHAGIEYIRDYYGVNDAADQAAPSLFDDIDPRAVAESAERIQELFDGYESGAFSETHYYGQLQAMVRALRTRYPGYNEQIDGIIQGITGITPANALISSLRSDAAGQAQARSDYLDDLDSWILEHETEMASLYETLFPDDPRAYTDLSPDERRVLADYGGPLRRAYNQEMESAWLLENLKSRIELGEVSAIEGWREWANNRVLTMGNVSKIMLDENVSLADLSQYVETYMRGGGGNREQLEGVITNATVEIHRIRQNLIDEAREMGVTDEEAMIDYIDNFLLAPYTSSLELLGGDEMDLSALGINQFLIEFQDTQLAEAIYQEFGDLFTLTNMIKEYVPEAYHQMFQDELFGEQGVLGPWWAPMTEIATAIVNGQGSNDIGRLARAIGLNTDEPLTFEKVMTQLTSGLDVTEAQEAINGTVDVNAAILLDPEADLESKQAAVQFFFGGEDYQGIDLATWDRREDKLEIFQLVASPSMSQSIYATGDRQMWRNYTQWVQTQWSRMNSEIINEVGADLEAMSTAPTENGVSIRSLYDINFNENTGQIELVRNGTPTPDFIGNPEPRVRELRRNIAQINMSLSNVNAMLEQEGATLDGLHMQQLFGAGVLNGWGVQFTNTDSMGLPAPDVGEGDTEVRGGDPAVDRPADGPMRPAEGIRDVTPTRDPDTAIVDTETLAAIRPENYKSEIDEETIQYLRDTQAPSGVSLFSIVEQASITGSMQALEVAAQFLGADENEHTEVLAAFFERTTGSALDPSEIAWCARFAKAVLTQMGVDVEGATDMALSFQNIGVGVDTPQLGDIVVFSRGGGFGHVGFFAGYGENGRIRVLGGNQSDEVNISEYATDNVVGYRRVQIGAPQGGSLVQPAAQRPDDLDQERRVNPQDAGVGDNPATTYIQRYVTPQNQRSIYQFVQDKQAGGAWLDINEIGPQDFSELREATGLTNGIALIMMLAHLYGVPPEEVEARIANPFSPGPTLSPRGAEDVPPQNIPNYYPDRRADPPVDPGAV